VGSNPIPSTTVSVTPDEVSYYVYILHSLTTGRFYIGHCHHLIERFQEHQSGYVKSTRNRGPWNVVYYEIYTSRSEAQKREYALKRKKNAKYIAHLIQQAYPHIKFF